MSFLWSLQTLILYRDSGGKKWVCHLNQTYRERSCSEDIAWVANLGIWSFPPSALSGFKPSSPCLAEALSRNSLHFLMGTCQVLCHGLLPAVTWNCPLCPSKVDVDLGHIVFSPPRLSSCIWSGRLWKGTRFLQLHLLGSLRLCSSPEDAPGALPVTREGPGSAGCVGTELLLKAVRFTHVSLGCWYLILYYWNEWVRSASLIFVGRGSGSWKYTDVTANRLRKIPELDD